MYETNTYLSFSSHRQGLALLPVPSLSRSRSRLFDDANPTNETLSAEIAALVRRFLEGSLKTARACKPATDAPRSHTQALVIREVTTLTEALLKSLLTCEAINQKKKTRPST